MKIERTKNTINGFVWGTISKVSNTLLPFLVRTVMIYQLGVQYLGLNSLFASVLQVLSLSELGFSSACVFAMYKPIAEDDYDTVGAILQYLKKIYYKIGTVFIFLGLLLLPFINSLISGDIPDGINIHILFLIYLLNSGVSYFFFAHKSSLLLALQCNDIINRVALITNTALKLTQCFLLLVFPNYYCFVILIPISTILHNLIKARIVDKKYKKYTSKTAISLDTRQLIKSRIIPLIGTKLSVVLINAADTIVISAFLGLTETALYNNYFFVMSSVQSIIFEIHSSMYAGVGNALVVDDPESVVKKFEMLNFLNAWLVTCCTGFFLCLFQPFMQIWVGEQNTLSNGMVVLFSAYFYVTTIIRVITVYKDAAGLWREDALRCYASCIINIVLNILTVRFIGLYGVIGSSIIVGLLIDPMMAKTVYHRIFNKSSFAFYKSYVINISLTACICGVLSAVCLLLPHGWIGIILRTIVCSIITNAMLFGIYKKNRLFKESTNWAKNAIITPVYSKIRTLMQ